MLKPIVTLIINGRIREAECPVCRDSFRIALEGADDQQKRLDDAFAEHLHLRHRDLREETNVKLTGGSSR